MEMKGCFSV